MNHNLPPSREASKIIDGRQALDGIDDIFGKADVRPKNGYDLYGPHKYVMGTTFSKDDVTNLGSDGAKGIRMRLNRYDHPSRSSVVASMVVRLTDPETGHPLFVDMLLVRSTGDEQYGLFQQSIARRGKIPAISQTPVRPESAQFFDHYLDHFELDTEHLPG